MVGGVGAGVGGGGVVAGMFPGLKRSMDIDFS